MFLNLVSAFQEVIREAKAYKTYIFFKYAMVTEISGIFFVFGKFRPSCSESSINQKRYKIARNSFHIWWEDKIFYWKKYRYIGIGQLWRLWYRKNIFSAVTILVHPVSMIFFFSATGCQTHKTVRYS